MQLKEKQSIEMVLRVHAFLGEFPPPESPGYTTQKAILDEIVNRLGDHSSDQVVGRRMSRAETRRVQALRRTLREDHLTPISRIARAMLADKPGIELALRLPSAGLSSMKLVAEADGFRSVAARYEQEFVQCGRPVDFLAQFDAAATAVKDCVLGKAHNTGLHIGAKRGIAQEIRRGRKSVEVMDTIVRAAFSGRADVMARWAAARRVQAVPFAGVSTGGGASVVGSIAPSAPSVPAMPPATAPAVPPATT